jgi:uncharacterized membrane protein (GlpM family)
MSIFLQGKLPFVLAVHIHISILRISRAILDSIAVWYYAAITMICCIH